MPRIGHQRLRRRQSLSRGAHFSVRWAARGLDGPIGGAPPSLIREGQHSKFEERFSAKFLERGQNLFSKSESPPWGWGSDERCACGAIGLPGPSYQPAKPRVLCAYATAATLACSASSKGGQCAVRC